MVRASVLRRRSSRPAAERRLAGRQIAEHGLALAAGAHVVAAHVAVGNEPPTRALLEALLGRGVRVVLPIVLPGHGLGWGDLVGWSALTTSSMGLLEPVANDEAARAARTADLLLVPAVAVDRAGHRLGRGGGYFDRWLPVEPRGPVVAVLYDDEVLDDLPHEPHDRRADAALTPSGVVPLGPSVAGGRG